MGARVQKIPALQPGERLVWYINVGAMNHARAKQYIDDFRQKIINGCLLENEKSSQHIFFGVSGEDENFDRVIVSTEEIDAMILDLKKLRKTMI